MTGIGVVAGVDGSDESWAAVQAAAWEATRRRQALTLVHGYFERLPYAAYGRVPAASMAEQALAGARTMVADVAARTREEHPELSLHTRLAAGGGASVLVQASSEANLIVVGPRGHGGFAGLSIGSVAAQTAAYAQCPVLVVRQHDRSEISDPVIVGVDGSAQDHAAVGFAFEEARLRGVAVVGMHVWWYPPEVAVPPMLPLSYQNAGLRDNAELQIADAMADWEAAFPDTAVEHRAVRATNPASTLIEASVRAALVVVGCRGRGGFASLMLGSVSRDLVGHAHAPVVIVHQHR